MNIVSRTQVLVQLDDAQVAVLDRLASAAGDNRSELIRRAIDLYVAAVAEAVADLRYAEAYERAPEDIDEFAALRSIGLQTWPEG